jgi:hypothetical protein
MLAIARPLILEEAGALASYLSPGRLHYFGSFAVYLAWDWAWEREKPHGIGIECGASPWAPGDWEELRKPSCGS